MKKSRVLLSILGLLAAMACTKKDTKFLITENGIGALSPASDLNDLEAIFAQDSIVKDTLKGALGSGSNKIMVFEKGGAPLLQLTPNTDSIPGIDIVRVLDKRYATKKGISLNSTFKDIQNVYGIKKIVTTMSSVVIFPKSSTLYFTIDKEELPASLRYTNTSIEAVQIPDDAKIKYVMLGWD